MQVTWQWELIRFHDATEELYDMHLDPNEWTNLAHVEELRVLKRELATWLPAFNARPRMPNAFPN